MVTTQRCISDSEAEALISSCAGSRRLTAYVLLALRTGMRIRELDALRWPHVREDGTIVVPGGYTKGSRQRTVAVTPRETEALAQLRSTAADPEEGYVFGNVEFNPLGRARLPRILQTRAGVRFADLRRTALGPRRDSGNSRT